MAWGMIQVNACVGTWLPLRCSNGFLIRLSENINWATLCVEVGGEEVADNAGKLLEWTAPICVEG